MRSPKGKSPSSPRTGDPWGIFEYEVEMYVRTRELLKGMKRDSVRAAIIGNALTESALLHTRVLIEILLDRKMDDDICLSELLPGWQTSENLVMILAQLKKVYGIRTMPNSPCWTLNKMLAHPSSLRTSKYNYSKLLEEIDPVIVRAIEEIAKLSKRSRLRGFLSSSNDSSSESLTAYTTSITTSIVTLKIDDDW